LVAKRRRVPLWVAVALNAGHPPDAGRYLLDVGQRSDIKFAPPEAVMESSSSPELFLMERLVRVHPATKEISCTLF
jgi:hypothetical protein